MPTYDEALLHLEIRMVIQTGRTALVGKVPRARPPRLCTERYCNRKRYSYSYDVHRSLHNNRVPPYHPSLDHPKDVHPSHAPTHRHHHLPLQRYTTVDYPLEAPMDVV